jgi:uracil-DNA glycosylase
MPTAVDEYPGAENFLPPKLSLAALREASLECRGCPLYKHATQTVFGEGRAPVPLLLVGEQPGNDEDLKGKPFVGPSGRLLDEALERAGIARDDAYVTNVVKHFKFELRGKRRIHKKPGAREIRACMPWLVAEVAVVRPKVLVCLGATAAQAVLGADFRVSVRRGEVMATDLAPQAVATVHPSSILRQPTPEAREEEMEQFVADLGVAAKLLRGKR